MALEKIGLGGILTFAETKAVAAMGRASKAFGGLRKGAANASKNIESFSRASRNAGLALAPLAIGIGFAIKKASDFEKSIAEISTIADEAVFPIKDVEKSMLDLAIRFGTAPIEQAKGFYQAVSAGAKDLTEATDLLVVSNELAVGGLSDTFTAVDVLTTATNSYAASNLEARDAADAIFTAVKAGKTTVDDLGRSLGAVIPTAAKLGIGFGELNAAVAAITKTGIVTAEATTGLNAALANVLKPSKEARETAKKLGIEFSLSALKAKGLSGFMLDVTKATAGNEEALTKLFGSVRGVRAVMALATDDAADFIKILEMMEESGGATKEAFDKMSKTFDFQMRRLSALKDVGFISLGKILKPLINVGFKPLVNWVGKFVKVLQAVATGNIEKLEGRSRSLAEGIREGLDWIVSALATIKATFESVGEAFGRTFGDEDLKTIGKWATIFVVVGAALSPILLAAAGVGFAISAILIPAMTGLLWVASLLLAPLGSLVALLWGFSIPVFIAVAAIAVLVGGLFLLKRENESLSDTVKRVTSDIGIFYREMVDDIVQFLITAAESWANAMLEPLRAYSRGVATLLQAIGVTVPAGVAALGAMKIEIPRPQLPPSERKFVTMEERAAVGKTPLGALAELPGQITGKIEKITEDIKTSVAAAQKAAEESEKAAKKKPCAKVEIDKREVGRAVAKHQDEVKTRSGFKATPYQRRQIVENGAI